MRNHGSVLLLSTLTLASCAAVRSTHVEAGRSPTRAGLEYSAPKGLVRIGLVDDNGALELFVSEPFFVGDPEATYVLSASSGLFANQEYLYVVNPQTRLLSYVNSSSEGQATQILRNAARSVVGLGLGLEEHGAGTVRTIFSRIIDPFALSGCDYGTHCDFAAVNRMLHDAAMAHCTRMTALNATSGSPSEAEPDEATLEFTRMCAQIARDPNFFSISLDPLFTPSAAVAGVRRSNDCNGSICYRAPAPYAMSLRVGNHTDLTEIVSFPNEAPVMAVTIPAGVFADARARVEMYQGMPARYVVDRDSELVRIASVPFDILEAASGAVSKVVSFRVNYDTERLRAYRSRADFEQAQRELRQRNAATPGGPQGTQPGATDTPASTPEPAAPPLEGDTAGAPATDESGAGSGSSPPDAGTRPTADNRGVTEAIAEANTVNTRGVRLPAAPLFNINVYTGTPVQAPAGAAPTAPADNAPEGAPGGAPGG